MIETLNEVRADGEEAVEEETPATPETEEVEEGEGEGEAETE